MRFSLTIAACVVSAALLAGCSTQSQAPATMPGVGAAQSAGTPLSKPFIIGHKLKPMELLKLQAEGKIPGPSPLNVMKQIYKGIKTNGPLHLKAHPNAGTVSVWAAATYDDYIVGLKKNLTKTLAVIPTYYSGCYYPTQLKVDHNRNIWAGCQDDPQFNGGAVSEWNNAGSALATYTTGCPSNWNGCDGYFYNYGVLSSAADANNVFAGVVFAYGNMCPPTGSCFYTYAAGVEYWPAGNPSEIPVFDALPYGPVYDLYYMDEDGSGNLWFTYYGCANYICGDGLGEISNPTSPSWTFTVVESPGTYQCAGGVYVSNAGGVLNVTDPCTRDTYQYSLPLSPGGSPMHTLGPTPTNAFGYGDPISGGFSQSGAKLILGDSEGWLDRGEVSTNKWKAKANPSVYDPQGAAFTPSDK